VNRIRYLKQVVDIGCQLTATYLNLSVDRDGTLEEHDDEATSVGCKSLPAMPQVRKEL
jgi:hypothetical protein